MAYKIPNAEQSRERFHAKVREVFEKDFEEISKQIIRSYEEGKENASLTFIGIKSRRFLTVLADIILDEFVSTDENWKSYITGSRVEVAECKIIFSFV